MKALIKGDCVIVEPFDEWTTANLAYLTGTEKDAEGHTLPGDGWTLVEDYVASATSATTEKRAETVEIDGKTYTREEIMAILNATL